MRQPDRNPINYFEPMVIIIMSNNLWNETFTAWHGIAASIRIHHAGDGFAVAGAGRLGAGR